MRFLKLLLYVILFVCVLWGLVITVGPTLIRLTINHYSNNTIKMEALKITPRLTILCPKLEFEYLDSNSDFSLAGVANSLTLDWSIFSNGPIFTISVGSTSIADYGSFERASLTAVGDGYLNLNEVDFELYLTNVKLDAGHNIDNISFRGSHELGSPHLKSLKLSANDASFFGPELANVQTLKGEISDLRLYEPIHDQILNISLTANGLHTEVLAASIAGFDLSLGYHNHFAKLNLDFRELHSEDLDIDVGALSSEFGINLLSHEIVAPITLNSKELRIMKSTASEVNIKAEMEDEQNGAVFKINSSTQKAEFSTIESYIAYFNNIDLFTQMSVIEQKSNSLVSGSLSATIDTDPRLNFSSSYRFNIGSDFDACTFVFCNLENFKIEYEIQLSQESMKGYFNCKRIACDSNLASHKVQTTHSQVFFSSLQQTNSFNPFILAFLFSEIMSGKKQGVGHLKDLLN